MLFLSGLAFGSAYPNPQVLRFRVDEVVISLSAGILEVAFFVQIRRIAFAGPILRFNESRKANFGVQPIFMHSACTVLEQPLSGRAKLK